MAVGESQGSEFVEPAVGVLRLGTLPPLVAF